MQRVFDATVVQLGEVGLGRLSIPDVAERAGVNKTSIYRRWPDKVDLVRDALADAMGHADDVPDTGTLRGDLLGLSRAVAGFLQSTVGGAMVRILLAEGSNPELRALANKTWGDAARRGPQAVLARAAARGELADGVDAARVLFTLAGAILHRVLVEQAPTSDAFVAQLVDLVLHGAARRRAPAKRGSPAERPP